MLTKVIFFHCTFCKYLEYAATPNCPGISFLYSLGQVLFSNDFIVFLAFYFILVVNLAKDFIMP